ncbi:MAG TPA: helix-turn-helix transcriptional regulator [Candidatus Limnocylindrales bacterium]|nr:helix-turn-helix transcriptional regulator [Candidatus Limnocylindrales bacterium]
MTARESPTARARARMQTAITELLGDLRQTRLDLGLSQARVARAAGMSRPALARMERGMRQAVDPMELAAVAAVLGLDLRVNAYPAGDPLRDAVSVRLFEALRRRAHPSIAWRTELPLPGPGERRAWDAVAIAPDGWTGVECISRFGAADATIRRANGKLADDPRITRLVLVINDTTRNRAALAAALVTVRAGFPLQTREVFAALEAGRTPRLNGIVLLRPAGTSGDPHVVHSGGKAGDEPAATTPKFVDKPVGRREPGP